MTDTVKQLREDARQLDMAPEDTINWQRGLTANNAADEIERNRAAIGELVGVLKGGVEMATNAHVYWDADQDAKVGKHLIALSGGLKGYDARSDAIHAAIAKHDTSTTTTKEQ